MSDYILGSGVERDLDAIWEYIASDNLDAADRWIAKLFDAFEALARHRLVEHRGRGAAGMVPVRRRRIVAAGGDAPSPPNDPPRPDHLFPPHLLQSVPELAA